MIVLYTGRRGCGKTLTMVKDAYKYYIQGWKIYSNMNLAFQHEFMNDDDILNIDSESRINDAVIVLDEIQVLIDSRKSMARKNVKFSHFIQQVRKRNLILLCTTQYTGTVDVRFRQHVDIDVKPKHFKEFHVCRATYIDITSINEYDIYDTIPSMIEIVYNCKPIYNLYNTNKIISLIEKEKVKKKS